MFNYPVKILIIFISSLMLLACHKPPVLDNKLALNILTKSQTLLGYSISIITNNPKARGLKPSGWNCEDRQEWVDAGVVACKNSGRSGAYLKFTAEGRKLLLGSSWGDKVLRNAKVIAVTQNVLDVLSVEFIDESHAIIKYTWAYDQHMPFSNEQLKKTIALNVPRAEQVSVILDDDEWLVEH